MPEVNFEYDAMKPGVGAVVKEEEAEEESFVGGWCMELGGALRKVARIASAELS